MLFLPAVALKLKYKTPLYKTFSVFMVTFKCFIMLG